MSFHQTTARRAGFPGRFRLRRVAMASVSLMLGIAVGYGIASTGSVAQPPNEVEAPTATVSDQFIRLNTVDLEALPTIASARGTTSIKDRNFLYWNIESLQRSHTEITERPGSPR